MEAEAIGVEAEAVGEIAASTSLVLGVPAHSACEVSTFGVMLFWDTTKVG